MRASKDDEDIEREKAEIDTLSQKFKNFVSKQEQTLRVSIYLLLNLSEDVKVYKPINVINCWSEIN